jgi:hypothetical protein
VVTELAKKPIAVTIETKEAVFMKYICLNENKTVYNEKKKKAVLKKLSLYLWSWGWGKRGKRNIGRQLENEVTFYTSKSRIKIIFNYRLSIFGSYLCYKQQKRVL